MGKQSPLKKQKTAKQQTPTTKEEIRVVHRSSIHADTSQLDRLIHERIRLGIVSALAVNTSLSFNELKRIVNTTDGNLSVHARRLEEAEYIECKKSFDGRTPKTEYTLTQTGKKALERYLSHMESLIKTMKDT